jgi:hypothetical protein
MKKYSIYSFILGALIISCGSDSELQGGVDGAPGKASLVFPENNQPCEVGNVLDDVSSIAFDWKASGDTGAYDLSIVNLETNQATYFYDIIDTKKSVSLQRGYPYSWNITSKNDLDVVTVSKTWKFYLAGQGTLNNAPSAPKALRPGLGWLVALEAGKILLKWESIDLDNDPLEYTLHIDTVDGKQDAIAAHTNLSETSLEVTVEANTIYYWSVMVSDGAIQVASDVFSFRTE